jgi:hypothetical protein
VHNSLIRRKFRCRVSHKCGLGNSFEFDSTEEQVAFHIKEWKVHSGDNARQSTIVSRPEDVRLKPGRLLAIGSVPKQIPECGEVAISVIPAQAGMTEIGKLFRD